MGTPPRATLRNSWPSFEQKKTTFELLGKKLFPSQLKASEWIIGPRLQPKVVQVMGGERAGKSHWTACEVASLVPWCELIFFVGQEYENTEAEFNYLTENMRRLGVLADVSTPKRASWHMDIISGTHIETRSFTRGPDTLITTGKAPDLVVLCEAGLLDEENFLAAYARVAERRGAVIMSGTMKRAKPWYVALYRELQSDDNIYNGKSYSFPTWENISVYPKGMDDPTLQALRMALGDDLFRERFGAEPVPSPLLVFGREFSYKDHVRKVGYDPLLPLWLAVDPGYAGAYAVLVVQAASNSDVRVIDEFYQQYATWHDAVSWLRNRPYVEKSGGLITNISRAVMDIAGGQHHGDRSQIEQWRDSTGIEFLTQVVPIETGINRLRDFLRSPFNGQPRITIDPSCEGLIWELTEGERYPQDVLGNPIREQPVDAHNHARKALSYLLVNAFGESDFARPLPNKPGTNMYSSVGPIEEPAMTRSPAGGIRFLKPRAGTRRLWRGLPTETA